MRPHGRKAGIEPESEKRAHLLDRAILDHAVEARIDRGIKRLTLRRDDEPQKPRRLRAAAARFAPCHSANETPVASITSSARTMRCGSAG